MSGHYDNSKIKRFRDRYSSEYDNFTDDQLMKTYREMKAPEIAPEEFNKQFLEFYGDEQDQTPQEAGDRGLISNFAAGVVSGTVSTMQGGLEAVSWLRSITGAKDKNWLQNPAEIFLPSALKEVQNEVAPDMSAMESWTPEWFAYNIGALAPFALSSIIPGAAGMSVAKAMLGGAKYAKYAGLIGAALGGGTHESMIEAGFARSDMLQSGATVDEADSAASNVFLANIGLNTAVSAFEFATLAKGLNALPTEKLIKESAAELAKNIGKTMGVEAVQEGTQQIIANVFTGKEWDEGLAESAVLGGIGGGVFGGGMEMLDNMSRYSKPRLRRIVQEQSDALDEAIRQQAQQGTANAPTATAEQVGGAATTEGQGTQGQPPQAGEAGTTGAAEKLPGEKSNKEKKKGKQWKIYGESENAKRLIHGVTMIEDPAILDDIIKEMEGMLTNKGQDEESTKLLAEYKATAPDTQTYAAGLAGIIGSTISSEVTKQKAKQKATKRESRTPAKKILEEELSLAVIPKEGEKKKSSEPEAEEFFIHPGLAEFTEKFMWTPLTLNKLNDDQLLAVAMYIDMSEGMGGYRWDPAYAGFDTRYDLRTEASKYILNWQKNSKAANKKIDWEKVNREVAKKYKADEAKARRDYIETKTLHGWLSWELDNLTDDELDLVAETVGVTGDTRQQKIDNIFNKQQANSEKDKNREKESKIVDAISTDITEKTGAESTTTSSVKAPAEAPQQESVPAPATISESTTEPSDMSVDEQASRKAAIDIVDWKATGTPINRIGSMSTEEIIRLTYLYPKKDAIHSRGLALVQGVLNHGMTLSQAVREFESLASDKVISVEVSQEAIKILEGEHSKSLKALSQGSPALKNAMGFITKNRRISTEVWKSLNDSEKTQMLSLLYVGTTEELIGSIISSIAKTRGMSADELYNTIIGEIRLGMTEEEAAKTAEKNKGIAGHNIEGVVGQGPDVASFAGYARPTLRGGLNILGVFPNSGDFSTFVHEAIGHLFAVNLLNKAERVVLEKLFNKPILEWQTPELEKIAYGFEKWLVTKEYTGFPDEVRTIFEKIKRALLDIYVSIRNTFNFEIAPELDKVFKSWISESENKNLTSEVINELTDGRPIDSEKIIGSRKFDNPEEARIHSRALNDFGYKTNMLVALDNKIDILYYLELTEDVQAALALKVRHDLRGDLSPQQLITMYKSMGWSNEAIAGALGSIAYELKNRERRTGEYWNNTHKIYKKKVAVTVERGEQKGKQLAKDKYYALMEESDKSLTLQEIGGPTWYQVNRGEREAEKVVVSQEELKRLGFEETDDLVRKDVKLPSGRTSKEVTSERRKALLADLTEGEEEEITEEDLNDLIKEYTDAHGDISKDIAIGYATELEEKNKLVSPIQKAETGEEGLISDTGIQKEGVSVKDFRGKEAVRAARNKLESAIDQFTEVFNTPEWKKINTRQLLSIQERESLWEFLNAINQTLPSSAKDAKFTIKKESFSNLTNAGVQNVIMKFYERLSKTVDWAEQSNITDEKIKDIVENDPDNEIQHDDRVPLSEVQRTEMADFIGLDDDQLAKLDDETLQKMYDNALGTSDNTGGDLLLQVSATSANSLDLNEQMRSNGKKIAKLMGNEWLNRFVEENAREYGFTKQDIAKNRDAIFLMVGMPQTLARFNPIFFGKIFNAVNDGVSISRGIINRTIDDPSYRKLKEFPKESLNKIFKALIRGTLHPGTPIADAPKAPQFIPATALKSVLSADAYIAEMERRKEIRGEFKKSYAAWKATKLRAVETNYRTRGKWWSDDELRSMFNMNPAEISGYRTIKNISEKMSLYWKKAAVLNGMPIEMANLIYSLNGYFPLDRGNGRWMVVYKDSTSDSGYGLDRYNTYKEAKVALEWRTRAGQIVATDRRMGVKEYINYIPEFMQKFSVFDLIQLISEQGIEFGEIEKHPELKKLLDTIKEKRYATARMIRRGGASDIDIRPDYMFEIFETWVEKTAKRYGYSIIRPRINSVIGTRSVRPTNRGELVWRKYADLYIKNSFDVDIRSPFFDTVRSIGFMWALGYNIKNAVLNLTQTLATTLPFLNEKGWGMGPGQAGAAYSKGMASGIAYWSTDKVTDKMSRAYPGLQSALEELRKDGVISANYTEHLIGEQSKLQTVSHIVGVLQFQTERANRAGSCAAGYIAAIDHVIGNAVGNRKLALRLVDVANISEQDMQRIALQYPIEKRDEQYDLWMEGFLHRIEQGRLTPEEKHRIAVKYAKHTSDTTQFIYGKHNLPMYIRSSGVLANMLRSGFLFKGFLYNYIGFLGTLHSNGGISAQAYTAAIIPIIFLAGISGLPFADDLKQALKSLGIADIDTAIRKAINNNVMADFILKGVPSILWDSVAFDMSRSAGAGTVLPSGLTRGDVPEAVADLFGGAPLTMTKRVAEGIADMVAGDYNLGARKITPVAMSNVIKGYRQPDMGVINSKGNRIMNPEEINGAGTTLMSMAGFKPLKVAKREEFIEAMRYASDSRRDPISAFNERYADAYLHNDPTEIEEVLKDIAVYNSKVSPAYRYRYKDNVAAVRRLIANRSDATKYMRNRVPRVLRREAAQLEELYK